MTGRPHTMAPSRRGGARARRWKRALRLGSTFDLVRAFGRFDFHHRRLQRRTRRRRLHNVPTRLSTAFTACSLRPATFGRPRRRRRRRPAKLQPLPHVPLVRFPRRLRRVLVLAPARGRARRHRRSLSRRAIALARRRRRRIVIHFLRQPANFLERARGDSVSLATVVSPRHARERIADASTHLAATARTRPSMSTPTASIDDVRASQPRARHGFRSHPSRRRRARSRKRARQIDRSSRRRSSRRRARVARGGAHGEAHGHDGSGG